MLAAMPVWGPRGHCLRTTVCVVLESGLTGNLASPGQDRYGSLATPVPGTVMAAQVLVGSSDFHLANEAVHALGAHK